MKEFLLPSVVMDFHQVGHYCVGCTSFLLRNFLFLLLPASLIELLLNLHFLVLL